MFIALPLSLTVLFFGTLAYGLFFIAVTIAWVGRTLIGKKDQDETTPVETLLFGIGLVITFYYDLIVGYWIENYVSEVHNPFYYLGREKNLQQNHQEDL